MTLQKITVKCLEVLLANYSLGPRPTQENISLFCYYPTKFSSQQKNLAWQQDESWGAELLTKIKDYFQEFLRKLSRISSSNSFGE